MQVSVIGILRVLVVLKANKGFTLIEILIAVVIIGILAAIATPSFLSQIGKSREVDARQQIATFLEKQQIYYIDKSEFATGDNWAGKLGMSGIRKSNNYDYSLMEVPTSSEFIDVTVGVATSKKKNIKAYLGAVVVRTNGEDEPEFISVICRAKLPGRGSLTASDLNFSEGLRCSGNTQAVR